MMKHRSLFLFAATASALIGCAGSNLNSRSSYGAYDDYCSDATIEFLGNSVVEPAYEMRGTRFGGISGIDYDGDSGHWYLISDDKGEFGPSRFYRATLDLDRQGPGKFSIHDVMPIWPKADEQGSGRHRAIRLADPESIRRLPGTNGVVWTNEGDRGSERGPSIHRTDLATATTVELPLSHLLMRDSSKLRGPRDNRSFEGLSIDMDGSIWLGLETGLIEDGDAPTDDLGADTKFLRLGQGGKIIETVVYPMDAIPERIEGLLADNGVSEMIKLPGASMLVIERSGRQTHEGGFDFSTRLYCASWRQSNGSTSRATKNLVRRFDGVAPAAASNFEGMAFGPIHPDGGRYFVVVADNNFAEGVSTYLSVYRLTPDPFASHSPSASLLRSQN